MSKLADFTEEIKREKLKIVDLCSECKCNIYFGEIYYEIEGKILCEDCLNIYKKKEEINIE